VIDAIVTGGERSLVFDYILVLIFLTAGSIIFDAIRISTLSYASSLVAAKVRGDLFPTKVGGGAAPENPTLPEIPPPLLKVFHSDSVCQYLMNL